jgi:hypothetical protein
LPSVCEHYKQTAFTAKGNFERHASERCELAHKSLVIWLIACALTCELAACQKSKIFEHTQKLIVFDETRALSEIFNMASCYYAV